mmetsp:Transcript_43190/g.139221  ORF Transcript_43190/g.139221 Transcript_43190/m.139221 type:complete len:216 (-) Transcript_43190:74-721(-)
MQADGRSRRARLCADGSKEEWVYRRGKTPALVSVDFPSSLPSIAANAFARCGCLACIALDCASLKSIGERAFLATSLKSIALPESLVSIGRGAFAFCPSLTTVALPAGLLSVGEDAFFRCSSLKRVIVPTTASIGIGAFPSTTTVLRLPPKRMRDLQRWYEAVDGALAYKRCRPLLYGWLERAQTRLGSYGPDGAARQRDLEEFEGDCALAAIHA